MCASDTICVGATVFMKYWIANSTLLRFLLVVGVAGWLAAPSIGQGAGEGTDSFVEDDAALLAEKTRIELNQELEAYKEETGCWILVKTLPQVTDGERQAQIFGGTWARWSYPQCAVVFFFIGEANSARMMLAPGMEGRLLPEEIEAILRGVVVPRFTADDPEGAVVAGVDSLQLALAGELEELPGAFRPRGNDKAIGIALIVVALAAFVLATYQFVMAFREKNMGRSRTP